MAKDLAIVLNNGSINSAVITSLAAQKYRPILVHIEATQQTGSRLRAAYDMQVAHFKPYREHTLAMPFLTTFVSAGMAAAAAQLNDPRAPTTVPSQIVDLLPLIAAAARFGIHYQAAAIYCGLRVGTQADELAQATEYMQIWNELIQMPCGYAELEIQTPLMELETWQVVDVGYQVAAPFDRTWSCAEDSSEPCWACRGCRIREAAFVQAGKPDPLRTVRKI
jgi:7-cyano-7-deazaguanine synthase in queuosine biosynthesis